MVETAERRMLGAIRASVYYACSLPFASAAAMPCYASTWQLTRQPISSFAFAMHSMAHPRRSRGERILAAGGHKDGRFVARIRILRPGAPQTKGQGSRGGAIARVGAMAQDRLPRKVATFGNYLGNGERAQSATITGMILVMPSTNDIRGVSSESQYPSDKRGPDLTSFTGQ